MTPCSAISAALAVIDAKLGAGVHAEIKFGQVTLKMLGIDVLINADDAAFEHGEKALQRVRVHIAARPFKLGVVNRFVLGRAGELEYWRAVADQAAALIQVLVKARADAAMVKADRADRAAALNEAENLHVVGTRALPGFGRAAKFHIVDLDGLALAAHRRVGAGVHCQPDTMAEEPRGFHAAIEHPLNLPGRDAFLGAAKQVDDLQPQMQRKMAVLEDRAHPHREGLLAGVALVEARAGRLAVQAADARRSAAMRANRAVRPKPRLDVGESGSFGLELRGVQNGLGHGGISYGRNTKLWLLVCQV